MIAVVPVGMQAKEFASKIDHASNKANFTKMVLAKDFLSRLTGDLFLNFCVCHEERYNQD